MSPPESLGNILANVMANLNMRNLRVAETEKYAHVTYFFNGGIEKPFPGEDRVLVQSPKVATYDLKPEMSAQGIADAVVKAIEDKTFDVMVVNFANADMVGHSGKIPPTIKAVETVDACLGQIYAALKRAGGAMIVTADHGNAEQMIDPGDRRPADGAYHQPCAIHRGRRIRGPGRDFQGRCSPLYPQARRCAAGHCSDDAWHPRRRATQGNDGARFAGHRRRPKALTIAMRVPTPIVLLLDDRVGFDAPPWSCVGVFSIHYPLPANHYPHLIHCIRPMNTQSLRPSDRWHAMAAGFLGWTLDAFDFFVVIFLLDTLAEHFHVTKADIVSQRYGHAGHASDRRAASSACWPTATAAVAR